VKDSFDIVLLVDESGSMLNSADEVVSSVNGFIREQRVGKGNGNLRIAKFAQTVRTLRDGDCAKTDLISGFEYTPAGMTALADAMVSEIDRLGKKLSLMSEDQRPATIIFATITDGGENSSSDVNVAKIKEVVQHQKDKYSWQFIFLASGIDAIKQGEQYGFGAHMRSYSSQKGGYGIASASFSAGVTSARGGGNVLYPFAATGNS
jgi:uncharacterized protein with von Willebrand factor type A (vWA) domain